MAELSIPSTMRAWTYRKRGPVSDVLKLDSAIPTPLLRASSDILVKVSHSALTPGASLTWLFPSLPFLARPYIPELDFSGVIAAAGPAVPGSLKPGTAVFGSILLPAYLLSGSGSMAEYVVVSANCVSPLPEAEGFGLAEAAGLNGNGQTAVLMLKNGRVGQGSKVFVNGGSSGVGTLLIQIAKAQGAYVVATGSVQSANMVKSLGADEVSRTPISLKFPQMQFIRCAYPYPL
jgi:NADPH:quinone reductase-like Zn-dependent oxidoreductase